MAHTKSALCLAVLALSLFLLGACSGRSPAATATPPPTATVAIPVVEDLARAYISAVEAEQPADYLALCSNEAIYLDNSTPYRSYVGALLIRNSQTEIRHIFGSTNFGMQFDSHTVSRDRRFVALNGTYTNTGKDGNLASVPIVIILEVKDGKIVREDWYYDNSAFY